ncbi:MAG: hypothetical protein FJ360_03120 [Thaumarchaeota archaeon]|nr:hypothetical protein [Nitrososphaerota archaeon]
MKKEYVVKSIDAAPNGKPYVLVSLMSAKELMDNSSPVSPFGSKVMGFSNMNDMVKELNKMFTGMGGMPSGITAIKLDMHEYKEMNLSVGDKVYLELTKAENTGV